MTGSQINFPKNTVTVSGAIVSVQQQPQKILLVAPLGSAGTATDGDLNENIQANANTLADITSIGAELVRAIRAVNEDTQLDAIFLADDGSAADAAGAIDFTGSTATATGELTVIIVSEQAHTLSVPITSGDSATVIGDALVAAIVADTTIPVTSVNTTGDVVITSVSGGTPGNDIPIEVRGTVAGVTFALTAMTAGATDPTFTGVFDVIEDKRYQTIIWAWADDTSELETLVDDRFNVSDDVLDGLGYFGDTDTLSNHLTAGAALNSFINYTGEKLESTATLKGAASAEMASIVASQSAALRARKLTEGSAIASLNVGESGSDSVGGPALASRPLANTPVFPRKVIKAGRGWSKLDITALKAVGISVVGNNPDANQVVLGEQLTTRNTFGGFPDDSFKFVNFFDTSVNIREFYFSNLKLFYGQSRLTGGDPVPGRPAVNVTLFTAKLIELYVTLSGPLFNLTVAGENNLQFFKENLVVTANIQTGKITWSAKSPIVTQVRELSGAIQIVFAVAEGVIGEGEEEENPENPEEPEA